MDKTDKQADEQMIRSHTVSCENSEDSDNSAQSYKSSVSTSSLLQLRNSSVNRYKGGRYKRQSMSNLPDFDEEEAKNQSKTDLLHLMIKHLKQNSVEADKFKNHLLKRLKEDDAKKKMDKCPEHVESIRKLNEEKKKLKKELATLQQELAEIKENNSLADDNVNFQELTTKLETTEKNNQEMSDKLKIQTQVIEDYKTELAKSNKEVNYLHELISSLQEDLHKEKKASKVAKQDLIRDIPFIKDYLITIEQQHIQLLENSLEKIGDLINDKLKTTTSMTQSTYAQKAASPPKLQKELHSLIISPSEGSTIPDIRQNLNEIKTRDYQIKKCISTAAGQMIIRCEDESSATKLKEKIEEKSSMKEKLQLQLKEPRGDKIIIFSIPKEVDEQELEDILRARLPLLKILKFHQKNEKEKSYHQVVEMDTYSYNQILREGRVLIRFSSCLIRKHVRLARCFRCQRFGHMAAQCLKKNPTYTQRCEFCADEHDGSKCPIKQEATKHKCVNCIDENNKYKTGLDINHPTSSPNCQTYHFYLRNERAKINKKRPVR